MTAAQHLTAVKTLMQVPGIGRREADNLVVLGITEVHHLKGQQAGNLYRLNRELGVEHDKSLIDILYTAILFAGTL